MSGRRDLETKLAIFDAHSRDALSYLVKWMVEHPDALVTMARGRLVEGHYRYRDRLMYEYGDDELVAQAAQELADAINYVMLLQSRVPADDSTHDA